MTPRRTPRIDVEGPPAAAPPPPPAPPPPRLDRPIPSPGEALCLVFIIAVLTLAAGVLGQTSPVFRAAAVSLAVFLFPTVTYALLYGHDLRRTFRLHPLPAASLLLALAVAVGAFVLLRELTWFLHQFMPPQVEAMRRMEADVREILAHGPGMSLLVIALLPAIAEESLFRGFLLSALAPWLGRAAAIFVSALLFGLLHHFPSQQIAMVFLGTLYGAAVLRTGSLLFSLIAHATNNALVLLCLEVPFFRSIPWLAGEAPVPPLPLACASVIVACGLYVTGDRDPNREAQGTRG
ncbi:MAG: CPBP family intramembrane metalloprotease [Planctomycetes bacterium]|nr:CPBP family intramembrane metalloprotease [Planctomycetota bacterium]